MTANEHSETKQELLTQKEFSEITTETKALATLNQVEEQTKQSIELLQNNDVEYYVKDFDELLNEIEAMNEFIKSKPYSDEEEKSYKKLRAKINKVKASITSEVNRSIAYHFDLLKDQAKQLKDALTETTNLLNTNIKESERKFKEAKQQELLKTYQDLVVYKNEYADLDLDDFFNKSWLNKSYSMNKAKDELIERLTLYSHIADKIQENIPLSEFQEKYQLITLIKKANWNLLTFETKFKELYESKPEPEENDEANEEIEENIDSKIDEVLEKEEPKETFVKLEVQVPMSQFKTVMNFFNDLGLSSEIID